jgi:hypothetical protein
MTFEMVPTRVRQFQCIMKIKVLEQKYLRTNFQTASLYDFEIQGIINVTRQFDTNSRACISQNIVPRKVPFSILFLKAIPFSR